MCSYTIWGYNSCVLSQKNTTLNQYKNKHKRKGTKKLAKNRPPTHPAAIFAIPMTLILIHFRNPTFGSFLIFKHFI